MPTLIGRGDDMRGAAVASRGAACDSGAPNPLPPSPTATPSTSAPAEGHTADRPARPTYTEASACITPVTRPEKVETPLHARDGSVRAYVVVDASDADWANQWRWSLHSDGYAHRHQRKNGRSYNTRLHRELLGLTHGDGLEGDHKDGDRLNCRRSNLKTVPAGKNQQNVRARGGSSTYRGVSLVRATGKWRAQVKVNGKSISAGHFDSEQDAANAAVEARRRLLPYSEERSWVESGARLPEQCVTSRAAVDSLTARPRASLSTSAQTQSETRRRG